MTIERFIPQLDGSKYASGNCTAASDAMWLYRASQGRISTTGGHIRALTGDTVGGLRLDQVQAVNASSYGIDLGRVYVPLKFATLKMILLDGRHGAHVQGGYVAIRGTSHDCFRGNFSRGHDMYVTSADATGPKVGDPGADGRYPGCPDGWQRYSWSLLGTFANKLPVKVNAATGATLLTLEQDMGPGYVYCYVTPADPPIGDSYRVVISGYTPLWNAPNGLRVSAVTAATYIATRQKIGGAWWYRIASKADGSHTDNAGRYFKPSRYTRAYTP